MPTNQQRRDAERRRLQQQLEERRAREQARKRTTLIASIVGTVVLIAAVVIVVVVSTGGSDGGGGTPPGGATGCAAPPTGDTATFQGVTVTGTTDLANAPTVKSASGQAPTKLECMDLVVGKGKPATPASTVSVQYIGALYKDGTVFDSSWQNGGQPATFPLSGVVPGFTQGIGGNGTVAPMREGGRRIMILPAALGYGAQGRDKIPPNAPLVFVVDLKSVS